MIHAEKLKGWITAVEGCGVALVVLHNVDVFLMRDKNTEHKELHSIFDICFLFLGGGDEKCQLRHLVSELS